MTEDIGTTKRKPLTPSQRLKLFEAHKGICYLCGLKIEAGVTWVDEHVTSLGLGGTNDIDNRAPVHVKCAAAKTVGDMAAINKAKRVKRRSLGIKPPTAGKIKSAGFAKKTRTHADRDPAAGVSELARRFGMEDDDG